MTVLDARRETARRSVWDELSGALADLGVFIPIAVVLIVRNSLSATAVLLAAGLMYLLVAAVYRLPVPVQPMKALTAFAIALELPPDVIAAAGLLMGLIFLVLSGSGLLALVRRAMPLPVVRGVQLAVAFALAKIALKLVFAAPAAFGAQPPPAATAVLALVLLAGLLRFPRTALPLAVVGGAAVMLLNAEPSGPLGPSGLGPPHLDTAVLWTALTALVLPQVPLTAASSCVATADSARSYYGERARRVTPGRLGLTVGGTSLLVASLSAMPMCHGSGGVTAHYRFGARTALAPALIGTAMVVAALAFGARAAGVLAGFPLWILAAMLAASAVLHIGLLKDLHTRSDLAIAAVIGVGSLFLDLALLLVAATAAWWLHEHVRRRRERTEVGA